MIRNEPDPAGRKPVSDRELADIARQLRGVIGRGLTEPKSAPKFATHDPPPSHPRRDGKPRPAALLRFLAVPLLPGLLMIAVALLTGVA